MNTVDLGAAPYIYIYIVLLYVCMHLHRVPAAQGRVGTRRSSGNATRPGMTFQTMTRNGCLVDAVPPTFGFGSISA